MACWQTTHFAASLSRWESRESVTEYRAPHWGQKKVLPSGIGPVRGMSAPPCIRSTMRLERNKIQRRHAPARAYRLGRFPPIDLFVGGREVPTLRGHVLTPSSPTELSLPCPHCGGGQKLRKFATSECVDRPAGSKPAVINPLTSGPLHPRHPTWRSRHFGSVP
jgi:hypothetical protein